MVTVYNDPSGSFAARFGKNYKGIIAGRFVQNVSEL